VTLDAALQSEIFRTFAAVIVGTLIVAGAALLVLERGLRRDVRKVWTIYRAWLWMGGAGLLSVALGRVVLIPAIALASMLAFKEYARATGLYRDWAACGVVYAGIATICVLALIRDPFYARPGWYPMFMALPVYVITALLMIPILRNRAKGQLQIAALAIVGFVYIGWMFAHLAFLANSRNPYGYVLFLAFAVALNDVAAFTFGKALGRRPLRSEISPNKTWEGSLGALAVSLAMPWLLAFAIPEFSALQRVLAGVIVGVGGQLGDLVISVIKRDVGIKDMGATIPGHGGVLDRIDSLIFTAPLFLHMVNYFNGLY